MQNSTDALKSNCALDVHEQISELTAVSVIIPALNEEAMIGRCLDSLVASDFEKDKFEVIVVDNGSTDRTLAIAHSYSDRLRIKGIQRVGVNVSSLRNAGVEIAHGEILAFLDADCLVPATWLSNAEHNMRSVNSGIVGGYIRIPEDSRWVSSAWYGVGYSPKDGEVSYVPSGNLLIRRSSFVKVGGFNDRLQTAEDFDLCVRARKAGLSVRAVAELAVVHLRTPQTLLQFYARERWHGAHVPKALMENLSQWKDFRAVAFALYMLLCAAGLVVTSVFGVLTRQFVPMLVFILATVTAACVCSLAKLRRVNRDDFGVSLPQLTILHIIYGMARARALITVRAHYPRST